MKNRIKQLMESQHMTQQVFAQFLEMSPASLSSIFNDRTHPTLNIVEAIKKKIPDVNTDWLLFGVGDVYIKSDAAADGFQQSSMSNEPELFGNLPSTEGSLNFDTPSSNASSTYPTPPQQRQRQPEVREEVKIIEHSPRKVTEIRVYYDDLTYETFLPSKK